MQQSHSEGLHAYPASNQASTSPLDGSVQSSLQGSHVSQASQLSQVPADQSCSSQSESTTNTQQTEPEADMDVSPTTPQGRSTSSSSPRPPDAPRKAKQIRSPIQLSPHAPVRKLDFDNAPSLMRALGSEQSCDSHHSGPGRG